MLTETEAIALLLDLGYYPTSDSRLMVEFDRRVTALTEWDANPAVLAKVTELQAELVELKADLKQARADIAVKKLKDMELDNRLLLRVLLGRRSELLTELAGLVGVPLLVNTGNSRPTAYIAYG